MKATLIQAKPVVAPGTGYINLYLRGDTLSPGEVMYSSAALAQKNIDQPDGAKGPRQHVGTVAVRF